MSDIRYVSISDMHFGEEDSLLTNLMTAKTETEPLHASPVMIQLVECLKHLISQNKSSQKPTLILNGDILELALTTTNQAAMVFERFIELILPKDGNRLFDRIIYVPGNHDHHLWETARETQYVEFINTIKPKKYLEIPWHTTNMFVEKEGTVTSYFLTRLVQRYEHLKDEVIYMAYPNFALFNEDNRRCVVFHHGHFIESIYHLISTLRSMIFPGREEPDKIWEIEAENFAWIDFFWSAMGRSGTAGQDIELIYEKTQDPEEFKKLLKNLSKSLADKFNIPLLTESMEAKLVEWALNYLVKKVGGMEKRVADRPLSDDAEKGLWEYMNGPLQEQITVELKTADMPSDVTFVFGHTHKPFEEDLNFKKYPQWVNVYNTGGWVVESVEPSPVHGGSVVLLDKEFNAAAIRMFNEGSVQGNNCVSVNEASHAGERANPLYTKIKGLVDPSADPWKSFSDSVRRAVYIREQNLRARIKERD